MSFHLLLLAALPFGMTATVFWMYVYAAVLVLVAIVKLSRELPQRHGLDRIMPFGRLFYAIPLGVFGTEHFTLMASIAAAVPRWIPAHTFWVIVIGAGFIIAALSIITLVQARLAAAVVGATFLIFVCVMDLPAAITHPHNRFFWALALRELSFGAGALAFAMPNRSAARCFPRCAIGIAALVYGVEQLLHAAYVPGIPLNKITPEWIPGHIFVTYFVGAALIVAGVCLVVNKQARVAAIVLGLTILLAVLWVYLPMLVAAPKELVALNFFFDTLMYGGAILLLANSLSG